MTTKRLGRTRRFGTLLGIVVALVSVAAQAAPTGHAFERAWQEAGLDAERAAAHALSRLAYGARPGQQDELSDPRALVAWLEAQLAASADAEFEAELQRRLPVVGQSTEEIARTYLGPGAIRRMAMRDGAWQPAEASSEPAGDSVGGSMQELHGSSMTDQPPSGPPDVATDRGAARLAAQFGLGDAEVAELTRLTELYGARPPRELIAQQLAQKVLRAVHSENQLEEMLVDFWFNHFNVSVQDNEARRFVLAYERDAIRPNVFGSFRDLLGATARHPAMLGYLDNAQSRAEEGVRTAMRQRSDRRGQRGRRRSAGENPGPVARPSGLNENYARELLELHTLGVDGGYTQEDVVEVARAFTGWTAVPPEAGRGRDLDRMRSGRGRSVGFVTDGVFVFHPGFHDAEPKRVLGHKMPAGRGIEDGEQVLDIVAAHPSTARFLGHKLAVRFVADDPPSEVVEALEGSFLSTKGDLRAVLRTLLEQPGFWASGAQKVRTPFEFVAASVRALDGTFRRPSRELFEALTEMGQRPYAWDAPTGWPDRSDQWLNSGGLLARMKFGAALVAGEISGVTVRPRAEIRAALEDTGVRRGDELRADGFERLVSLLVPHLEVGERESLASQLAGLSAAEKLNGLRAEAQLMGWLLGSPGFQTR